MRRHLVGLAAIALAVLLLPSVPVTAQQKLKFAHVYETSEPYHKWALWAADEIAKRTDNRYTMEVFPASSLGKEIDINQGLTLGTVDVIYTGALFAGRAYGPVAISGAPFMFRDLDHWKAYARSDLFKELGEGYRKATQNKVLSLTYYGNRHVTSNREIHKPEDMRGLKIRVPEPPLYQMFPKAVSANPTPIAFAEVYLALQNGTVDAQENPLPTIYAKKFYEVQKYIVLTGHITDALLTIVGGPLWNRLSDGDKTVFEEVFSQAAVNCTDDIVASEKKMADELAKLGPQIVAVDRGPFREAVVKEHLGSAATWTKEQYDRLQALK